MDKERIVTQMSLKEDEDQSLRPQSLDQYIGQDNIKEMLTV
jgi:Holliday junction DNA helicase RuvB